MIQLPLTYTQNWPQTQLEWSSNSMAQNNRSTAKSSLMYLQLTFHFFCWNDSFRPVIECLQKNKSSTDELNNFTFHIRFKFFPIFMSLASITYGLSSKPSTSIKASPQLFSKFIIFFIIIKFLVFVLTNCGYCQPM